MNKYIYYIDVDTENIVEIDNEYIEDLIEAIKNHMVTIKTDKNIDACFLPEIEKYFKNTINLITERKSEEEHKQIYPILNHLQKFHNFSIFTDVLNKTGSCCTKPIRFLKYSKS